MDESSELNLADQLAIDRTNLGNKRTLFSSIRTSLGLFGVAAALLKLFQHDMLHLLGHIFIFISILIFIYGFFLYHHYNQYLNRISNRHKHVKAKYDE